MQVKNAAEALKTLNLGAIEIQFQEKGEGQPLLLVHGGVFADWFLLWPQARYFAASMLSESGEPVMAELRLRQLSALKNMHGIWQRFSGHCRWVRLTWQATRRERSLPCNWLPMNLTWYKASF